jgi:hypothetical protein
MESYMFTDNEKSIVLYIEDERGDKWFHLIDDEPGAENFFDALSARGGVFKVERVRPEDSDLKDREPFAPAELFWS